MYTDIASVKGVTRPAQRLAANLRNVVGVENGCGPLSSGGCIQKPRSSRPFLET
jgi:hypothetical protein